jgi:anti-sigma B factor antagonist
MRTDVTIAVREINDQVNAVDIGGELTSFAEAELTEALNQASTDEVCCILLNFRELTYMNSSGIGLLVTSLIRFNRKGKRIVAVELRDHFRQIFELTKLNEAIHLYDSEQAALEAEDLLG